MVTMVHPSPAGRDSALERAIARLRAAGELFRGPRSFAFWHIAVAYSLMPASPLITQTPRRRVYQLPNGRWSVVQTGRRSRFRPRCTCTFGTDSYIPEAHEPLCRFHQWVISDLHDAARAVNPPAGGSELAPDGRKICVCGMVDALRVGEPCPSCGSTKRADEQ
jgi:hypothetical protein